MEAAELITLAAVEDRHWWYRERRALLEREIRRLAPGRALDIGAAGGGNTRLLGAHGWQALALDHAELAVGTALARGIDAMRADARELPVRSGAFDLVTAFDVLEHVDEDYSSRPRSPGCSGRAGPR